MLFLFPGAPPASSLSASRAPYFEAFLASEVWEASALPHQRVVRFRSRLFHLYGRYAKDGRRISSKGEMRKRRVVFPFSLPHPDSLLLNRSRASAGPCLPSWRACALCARGL